MTPEQDALVRKAQDSLRGAQVLASQKLFDFAVSRAYYTMFYEREALEEIDHAKKFLDLAKASLDSLP
jgi:uncharacterized protein (UPF0332 family)